MKVSLMSGIQERRLIHLVYRGRPYKLEPYFLGSDDSSNDVVFGRQISPQVPENDSWRIFRLREIYGLLVLDSTFTESVNRNEVLAKVSQRIKIAF